MNDSNMQWPQLNIVFIYNFFSVCSKTFIEPGDVRKHMKTHTKVTGGQVLTPAHVTGDSKPSINWSSAETQLNPRSFNIQ